MSRILVTGANGFVGSALCDVLQANGESVVAAVRKASRADQYPVGDITVGTNWAPALLGCKTVIHLAARVHVMTDRAADPLADFRAMNVDATVALARQAAEAGVRRFVFISSIKINGERTTDRPFSETDIPAPQDSYGISKLEAEYALTKVSRETGLEVVVVRPPLVYGPNVRANFRRLMRLVQQGLPLPFGAIENRRSMVSLDNLVDLLIMCADHPKAAGQTFMVSDGIDVSTPQLLRFIAAAMKSRLWLVPVPSGIVRAVATALGQGNAVDRLLDSLQVDLGHVRSTLDWKPVVSTGDSIQKTVAYFLAQHGQELK